MVLRRPAEELRIPVEAMAEVRAEGRSVEIELLGGAAPVVYRVEGVSAAGAAAFAQAVDQLLPPSDGEAGPVDGLALVDVRPLSSRNMGWLSGQRPVAVAGALLYAGLAAVVGVAGSWGRMAALLGGSFALYAGGFLIYSGVRTQVEQWRLKRRGITVMAQFSHYTNKRLVYTYTTATGQSYTYRTTGTGTDPIEVTYDPARPGDARQVDGLVGMLVIALFLAIAGFVAALGTVLIGHAIAALWSG
ncbi:hypothetical protein ACFQ3Z_43855 [Streptomyces nogalater]